MSQSLLNGFRGSLLGPIIAQKIISQKETVFNWQIINQKIIIDLIQKEITSPETCQAIASDDEQLTSGEFILRILPLILFFHETEYLLSEQLEKIEKYSNLTQKIIEEASLFRQIIYLIFKQEENCLKNISHLSPSLKKIQTFLDNQIPLTEVERQFRQQTILDNNYLILSLYCFYRTPDNFKLSILQASRFNHPLILSITATLSGAYNGYSNIPIPWRLTITPDKDYKQLYQQISQLWVKWAGVEDPLKMIRPLETEIINSVRINNH